MVPLSATPPEAITNTQKVAGVFMNGRYSWRAEIDKMLAGVEAAALMSRILESVNRAYEYSYGAIAKCSKGSDVCPTSGA